LDFFGCLDACHIKEGGGVVDVLDEGVRGGSGWDDARPADEEGHFERFFEHPTLVVPSVFAEIEALIG